jgi:hypothetical protein
VTDISWVETDSSGRIVEVCEKAAAAFNLSVRGLIGRDLVLFFPADRDRLLEELHAVARGLAGTRLTATMRPRERKPIQVIVTFSRTETGNVRWDFARSDNGER